MPADFVSESDSMHPWNAEIFFENMEVRNNGIVTTNENNSNKKKMKVYMECEKVDVQFPISGMSACQGTGSTLVSPHSIR